MVADQTPAAGPAVGIHPGISSTFGHAWETLKRYFPEMILMMGIQILFSLPMGLIDAFADEHSFGYIFFSLFNAAYALIIMAPLGYGANWLCLRAVRGESFKVQEMFDAYRQTLQIMLATILVGVVVAIGFVMLIVPGIIFACRLSQVSYLVMEKKLEAVEAVRTSWSMTGGYSWTIFGMAMVSFLVILGGIILLIVGVFPAILWISLAFAAMYHALGRVNV